MIKMLTLILGEGGGSRVKNNFTNGFPDPENLYNDCFVRKFEYVSEIKNIDNSDPNFEGVGGQKIAQFFSLAR